MHKLKIIRVLNHRMLKKKKYMQLTRKTLIFFFRLGSFRYFKTNLTENDVLKIHFYFFQFFFILRKKKKKINRDLEKLNSVIYK